LLGEFRIILESELRPRFHLGLYAFFADVFQIDREYTFLFLEKAYQFWKRISGG
jgi:hypothetical protein